MRRIWNHQPKLNIIEPQIHWLRLWVGAPNFVDPCIKALMHAKFFGVGRAKSYIPANPCMLHQTSGCDAFGAVSSLAHIDINIWVLPSVPASSHMSQVTQNGLVHSPARVKMGKHERHLCDYTKGLRTQSSSTATAFQPVSIVCAVFMLQMEKCLQARNNTEMWATIYSSIFAHACPSALQHTWQLLKS